MKTRLVSYALVALSIGFAPVARAQSAAEHTALGDKDHAAGNIGGALKHYEAALAADPANYDALCKAARDAVDLGEFNAKEDERKALFKAAEGYGRRAVAANPKDADGHFYLARAIGKNALTMGTRDRIKFAGEVREHALAALEANPKHAGALHVMGVWNAEVMRLNGVSRMIAKNFLGGKVFGEASWDNALKYLEQATAAEPNRITHHLDLGRVYADRKAKDKAREQFEWIARAPVTEYNDRSYKAEAEKALKDLR
jgi:tetratricopeptide (TPR) repeat protein